MGYIIEFECKKCNYKQNLYLGQGMRDHRLDTVIRNYPEEVRGDIVKIIGENGTHRNWRYERRIGVCSHCQKLTAVSEITALTANGAQNIKITGRCDCGESARVIGGLTELEKEGFVVRCPRCNAQMIITTAGMWD